MNVQEYYLKDLKRHNESFKKIKKHLELIIQDICKNYKQWETGDYDIFCYKTIEKKYGIKDAKEEAKKFAEIYAVQTVRRNCGYTTVVKNNIVVEWSFVDNKIRQISIYPNEGVFINFHPETEIKLTKKQIKKLEKINNYETKKYKKYLLEARLAILGK